MGEGILDFCALTIAEELPRIEANFRNTGSDHFPIASTVEP